MRYSLRQLEVFLATAHFENISKAAQTLHMSQSAASTSLKELESQFDIQLFDRVGKRLQLNELGKGLRPQAESLLAKAQELEQALSLHKQLGGIRIGATLTIGNYLAVDLISRYKLENSEAKVALTVANTSHICEQLLNFDIDLALIEGEINHPDLIIQHWRDDELAIFCSPKSPYAQSTVLKDKALVQAAWVVREPGSGTRQTFDKAMSGLLSQLDISLELEHGEGIKRAVQSNLGLGCLSRLCLEDDFASQRLIRLYAEQRTFKRQFYLAWHKDKYLTEGLKTFMAYL